MFLLPGSRPRSRITPVGVVSRTTVVGDQNYGIAPTDMFVNNVNPFTAPRTWTMPPISSCQQGQRIFISAGGLSATNTLTLKAAGTDVFATGTANPTTLVSDNAYLYVELIALTNNNGTNWTISNRNPAPTNFVWVDRNNVDQSVTDNASVKVQLNHEVSDPDGVFDSVTNFRYTPNVAGTYSIQGSVRGTTAGSSVAAMRDYGSIIYKNGVSTFQGGSITSSSAGVSIFDQSSAFSVEVPMNGTTDFIELFVFTQNNGAGGTNTVRGATNFTFFTAQRIGP